MAGESCKEDSYLTEEIPLERKKSYLCLTEKMSDLNLELDPSSSDTGVELLQTKKHDKLGKANIELCVENASLSGSKPNTPVLSDEGGELNVKSSATKPHQIDNTPGDEIDNGEKSIGETTTTTATTGRDGATCLLTLNNKNMSNDNDLGNCAVKSGNLEDEEGCNEGAAVTEHVSGSGDAEVSGRGNLSPGLGEHQNDITTELDTEDIEGTEDTEEDSDEEEESENGARCSLGNEETARDTTRVNTSGTRPPASQSSASPGPGSSATRGSLSRGQVRVTGRPQGPQRPQRPLVMDAGFNDDVNDGEEEEIFFFATAPAVAETVPDLSPGDLLNEAAQIGNIALWDPVGPALIPEHTSQERPTPETGPFSPVTGSAVESPSLGAGSPPTFSTTAQIAHGAAGAMHTQLGLNRNDTHGANNRETMALHPTLLRDDSVDPVMPGGGMTSSEDQQAPGALGIPVVDEGAVGAVTGTSTAGNTGSSLRLLIVGHTVGLNPATQNVSSSSIDPSTVLTNNQSPQQTLAAPQNNISPQQTFAVPQKTARFTQSRQEGQAQPLVSEQKANEDYTNLYEDWDSSDEGTVGSLVGVTKDRTIESTDCTEQSNGTEDGRLAAAENDFLSLEVKRHSSGPIIEQRERTDQDADDLLHQIISGRAERGMGPNVVASSVGECSQQNSSHINTTCLIQPEFGRERTALRPKSPQADQQSINSTDGLEHKKKKKSGGCEQCRSGSCDSDGFEISTEFENLDETSHGIPNINTQTSHSTSVEVSQDLLASSSEGSAMPGVTNSDLLDSSHTTGPDSKSDYGMHSNTQDAMDCLQPNILDEDLETEENADKSEMPSLEESDHFQPAGIVADTNSNLTKQSFGDSGPQELERAGVKNGEILKNLEKQDQYVRGDDTSLTASLTDKRIEVGNKEAALPTQEETDSNLDTSKQTGAGNEGFDELSLTESSDGLLKTAVLKHTAEYSTRDDESVTQSYEGKVKLDTIYEDVCGDASSAHISHIARLHEDIAARPIMDSKLIQEHTDLQVSVQSYDTKHHETGSQARSEGPAVIDSSQDLPLKVDDLKCQGETDLKNSKGESSFDREGACGMTTGGESDEVFQQPKSGTPTLNEILAENNDTQPTKQAFLPREDLGCQIEHEGVLETPGRLHKTAESDIPTLNLTGMDDSVPSPRNDILEAEAMTSPPKLTRSDHRDGTFSKDSETTEHVLKVESQTMNNEAVTEKFSEFNQFHAVGEDNTHHVAQNNPKLLNAEHTTNTTCNSDDNVTDVNMLFAQDEIFSADESKEIVGDTLSCTDGCVDNRVGQCEKLTGINCDESTDPVSSDTSEVGVGSPGPGSAGCDKEDHGTKHRSSSPTPLDNHSEEIDKKSPITGNRPSQVNSDLAHVLETDFGQPEDRCNSSDQPQKSEHSCTNCADTSDEDGSSRMAVHCKDSTSGETTKTPTVSPLQQEEKNGIETSLHEKHGENDENEVKSVRSEQTNHFTTCMPDSVEHAPNNNASMCHNKDEERSNSKHQVDMSLHAPGDCYMATSHHQTLQPDILLGQDSQDCGIEKSHVYSSQVWEEEQHSKIIDREEVHSNLDCNEIVEEKAECNLCEEPLRCDESKIPSEPDNKEHSEVMDIKRKSPVVENCPPLNLDDDPNSLDDVEPSNCNSQTKIHSSQRKELSIKEEANRTHSQDITSEGNNTLEQVDADEHEIALSGNHRLINAECVRDINCVLDNEEENTEKRKQITELEGEDRPFKDDREKSLAKDPCPLEQEENIGDDKMIEEDASPSKSSCTSGKKADAANKDTSKVSSSTELTTKLDGSLCKNSVEHPAGPNTLENEAQQKDSSCEQSMEDVSDRENPADQTSESLTCDKSFSSSDTSKEKVETSRESREDHGTTSTSVSTSASSDTGKTKSSSSESGNKQSDFSTLSDHTQEKSEGKEGEAVDCVDTSSDSHTDTSESFSENTETKQESTVDSTTTCEQDITEKDKEEIVRLNKNFHDAQSDICPEKAILEATDLWLERVSDMCKSPTVLSDSRSDAKLHQFTVECKAQLLAISKYKLGTSASMHGARDSVRATTSSEGACPLRSDTAKEPTAGDTGEKLQPKLAFGNVPRLKHVRPNTRQPMSCSSRGEPNNSSHRLSRGRHQPRPPSTPRQKPPCLSRVTGDPYDRERSRHTDGEIPMCHAESDVLPRNSSQGGRGDVCSTLHSNMTHSDSTADEKPNIQHEEIHDEGKSCRLSSREDNPHPTLAVAEHDTLLHRTPANRQRRRQRGDIKPKEAFNEEANMLSKSLSFSQTHSLNSKTQRSPKTKAQKCEDTNTDEGSGHQEYGRQYSGTTRQRQGCSEQTTNAGGGAWPRHKTPSRAYLLKPKPPLKMGRPLRDGASTAAAQRPKATPIGKETGSGVAREKIEAPTLQKRYRPQRILTMKEFEKEQAARHLSQDFRKISRTGPSVDCHMNPYVMRRAKASVERQRAKTNHNSLLALENCRFLDLLNNTKSVYHGTPFQSAATSNTKSGRISSQHFHSGQLGRHGYSLPTRPAAPVDHGSPAWTSSGHCPSAGDHVTSQWAVQTRHKVVTPRGLDSYLQAKMKIRLPQPPSCAR